MKKPRLGAFLVFSVVFADIGSSVYYVPGILYGQVGALAAPFIALSGLGCCLLAVKYVDITARYPEGGGVVTVARHVLGDWASILGGLMLLITYFLTVAISASSAIHYLDSVIGFGGLFLPIVIVALLALGVLNVIGIRESATVTAVVAAAALAVDGALLLVCAFRLSPAEWQSTFGRATEFRTAGWNDLLRGYAGAWLAFSGLESISQIGPAIGEPRRRIAGLAMVGVVVAILATSPIFAAWAAVVLTDPGAESVVADLGLWAGGIPLKLAVVLTASALLLFASNTAIIGGYHVCLAMGRSGYLPQDLIRLSPRFRTPHVAIALMIGVPALVILTVRGSMDMLGDLYAFGLLGAFTLASVSVDIQRTRERRLGVLYALGWVTTIMVTSAWAISLWAKPLATLFGGVLTALGMALVMSVRRGWIPAARPQLPFLSGMAAAMGATARGELGALQSLDTLAARGVELRTVLAIRYPTRELIEAARRQARASRDHRVGLLYVDEVPGLFYPGDIGPSPEARLILGDAMAMAKRAGVDVVPVWHVAKSAGRGIAEAAAELKTRRVVVGTPARGAVWRILRGSPMEEAMRHLPKWCALVVVPTEEAIARGRAQPGGDEEVLGPEDGADPLETGEFDPTPGGGPSRP